MEITRWRLLALGIGVVEIVGAGVDAGWRNGVGAAGTVGVALALIWFSEVLGSATGFIGHGEVTSETPGWMVAAFGWCVLVGVPVGIWIWGG